MNPNDDVEVKVYTRDVQTDPNAVRGRQVGLESLVARGPEIEAAVRCMSDMLAKTAKRAPGSPSWGMAEIEAKFTISLGINAGVIVARGSADAALEVRILLKQSSL